MSHCPPRKGGRVVGLLKKYPHRTNLTAVRHIIIPTTCRGGLACPPVTRCPCTIYTFIYSIYGNQNQMVQAVTVLQNSVFSTASKGLQKVQCRYIPPCERVAGEAHPPSRKNIMYNCLFSYNLLFLFAIK